MMASAMPISPASTPRRAVRGWLSHLSERMNSAAATRYVALPSQESATSRRRRRLTLRRRSEQSVASAVNHGCGVSRRNILSMRSVIQKPPTMLVVAAITASVPSTVLNVVCPSAMT